MNALDFSTAEASPLASRIDAHQLIEQTTDAGRDGTRCELEPLLARHGVECTVLVQAGTTAAETELLLDFAREHAFVAGVVGWVDLAAASAAETLAQRAADPLFKGVRVPLQHLAERDWIATRPHEAAVRALVAHGLRIDVLAQPWHLPALVEFVQAWPTLPVMIDHAAQPQLGPGGPSRWAAPWRRGLTQLARCPNVSCKLSGLLDEPPGAAGRLARLRPVFDTLLEQFGPGRIVWGSDWPALNRTSDYAAWIDLSEALIADLSEAARASIRGNNARRFYALAHRPATVRPS
jgi:L-fuconolactonase